MIRIDHSSLMFLGREVQLYGLIAVLGAVVITLVNTLLARRRGLDASFTFRLTLLSIFGMTAFHIFGQALLPYNLLKWFYLCGFVALPLLYLLVGRLFRQNSSALAQLGVLTVLEYAVVTRWCCLFAGCCYGPAWSGLPALVYGPNTHNPLPGVPLFPLQPVMALAFLVLAIIGGVAFVKKWPRRLLWITAVLNLIVYYTGILVSPANPGQQTEAVFIIILSSVAALGLSISYLISKKKGL